MCDRHVRDAIEEIAALEEETFVLVVAWSGTLADTQTGIAVTCLRMHERLKSVRQVLKARCGR